MIQTKMPYLTFDKKTILIFIQNIFSFFCQKDSRGPHFAQHLPQLRNREKIPDIQNEQNEDDEE